MLKKAVTNPNRRSTHYHRQSRFEGSDRQIRARILKLVVRHKNLPLKELAEKIDVSTEKLELLVDQLVKEGFLFRREENVGLMT
jgi:A/G-specific adenine glycosylase